MSESHESVRVLHLDHSAEPGGAELALVRLVSAPCPWQPTVHVSGRDAGVFALLDVSVTLSGVDQPAGATAATGWRSRLGFAASLVVEAWRLRRSAAFADADLVHANTTRMIVVARLALLFSRRPLVASVRDIVTVEALGRLTVQLVRHVGLRRATAVIANSRSSLEAVEPWLRPSTARTVVASPIGVSKNVHRHAGPEFGPVMICMVARIDPWKGQAEVIEACARQLDGIDWRLKLAGSPAFGHSDYLDDLGRLIHDLGVEGRVELLGHVTDIVDLLDAADICVQFSTRPEPLGQNVLQYLARGSAVVAANAGGPAEWIQSEDNGILVEIGDVEGLGETLRRLASDTGLRARLGAAAVMTPGLCTDAEVAEAHQEVFVRALEQALRYR